MPLVVPGLQSAPGDKTAEWTNKLVGKTLSDDSTSNETTFAKRELPAASRVVEPGMMMTRDHNPDRLNVHVKEDGTVSHVTHG